MKHKPEVTLRIEVRTPPGLASGMEKKLRFFLLGRFDRPAETWVSPEEDTFYWEVETTVKRMLEMSIQACRKQGKYVGICGQGPSDHPDLARWLLEQGISSVSLNPDTVIDTWIYLAEQAKTL
jgi:phosphoenolpyruvate synthase/pyruvate phosphate dikinase